ncbi:hypothetical protein CLIB1444_11S01508 [[Candida] jaroonii]|uniref:Uncharacterized protein n=1 Tax=[Candida] jaroonii TaxID=467808 RepID=A0ACA9YD07_9ASCO|nr:hypothetical protein CLIB1444_11S01508 [[Candida] jaroonii]
MTSLRDIKHRPRFDHLNSSIPSVDDKHFGQHFISGIYDFQTVPNNVSVYLILSNFVIKHLENTTYPGNVVIVSLSGNFPLDHILENKKFQQNWIDNGQLKYLKVDTVTNLIILLNNYMKSEVDNQTLFIFDNFHNLLDFYKLELSQIYQESMLRNHIFNLDTIEAQAERQEIEGLKPDIVEIPENSHLIRESPLTKFNNHVRFIMNLMTNVCFKYNSIAFITGKLDSRFEAFKPRISMDSSNIESSQRSGRSFDSSQITPEPRKPNKGRMVLKSSNSNLDKPMGSQMSLENPLNSFITERAIFFKDWYHKTLHCQKNSKKAIKRKPVYWLKINNDIFNFEHIDGGFVDLTQSQVSSSSQIPSDIGVSAISDLNLPSIDEIPSEILPTASQLLNEDIPSSPTFAASQIVSSTQKTVQLPEKNVPTKSDNIIEEDQEIVEDSQIPDSLL